MTKSSVAIIGKSRLADELLALAQDKGLEPTPLTDATAVGSTTNFVIDSETGAEDKKRALLQRLDASLPASSVIVVVSITPDLARGPSNFLKLQRL